MKIIKLFIKIQKKYFHIFKCWNVILAFKIFPNARPLKSKAICQVYLHYLINLKI